MTLNISSVFTYDTDAGNYIQAVEAADEADTPGIGALEPATRQAINNFVVGCKQDGIWDAIKASCILAGARTLSGALVPLAGTAPTNFNFVSGDYNRKTGLVGDGSSKYLDSNRNNNADPQNNKHVSVYLTVLAGMGPFLGSSYTASGAGFTWVGPANSFSNNMYSLNTSTIYVISRSPATGFYGMDRSSTAQATARYSQTNKLLSSTSASPYDSPITIHKVDGSAVSYYGSSRLAFYSIGEALDLALLDARVTDLITAFGAAIP